MYENGQDGTPGEFPAAAQGTEMPTGASSTPYEPVAAGTPSGTYGTTGSAYPPPPGAYAAKGSAYPPPPGTYAATGQYPPPGSSPQAAVNAGLSDTAAGAIAYITIVPAILFLILAPYNQKPFVKFHAFQCLGLGVAWICLSFIGIIPILGWIVLLLGSIVLLVVWVMSIIKASQGSALKLPVVSQFASDQSGYRP